MKQQMRFAVVIALTAILCAASSVKGQDLTTQLAYFLIDLRSGAWGTTVTPTSLLMSGTRLTNSAGLTVASNLGIGFSATTSSGGSVDTQIVRRAAGEFGWTAVLFAALGTPANGTFAYCSDCTVADPCAGSGTGALAKRLNGAWVCN